MKGFYMAGTLNLLLILSTPPLLLLYSLTILEPNRTDLDPTMLTLSIQVLYQDNLAGAY